MDDPAKPLRNRTAMLPGVDFRTTGGYVVLPPSSHQSGREYEWENSAPLAPLPAEVAALVGRVGSGGPEKEPLPSLRSMLDGVPEGKRDDSLFRKACQLRRLLGDDRALIEELILKSARASGFPEEQARVKVEQAFKMDHSDGAEDVGPDTIRRTDGGNGVRFARWFGQEVLYVEKVGWMQWDSAVWRPMSEVEAEALGKQIVENLYTQATVPDLNGTERAKQLRFAMRSDSPAAIRNMLTMARSDVGLWREATEMDTDPYKLAVQNGVVNLKTGDLEPISRHDLITGRSPFEYDPATPTPKWTHFLRWAMRGDDEMIEFIQRLVGYALTGESAGAHIMPIFLGPGRNGKNVFVEVIVSILGELATFPFPANAITERNEEHKYTAALFGKRLAVINELNQRVRINSAIVKTYTGDGQLLAKRLYKDEFTFRTTHSLWLVSNHRPKIDDNSHAMWSRILEIPWQAVIAETDQVKNYHHVMLAEEGPGIVAWAVEGAVKYTSSGLAVPSSVRAATNDYREREDVLGDFVKERLMVAPDLSVSRQDLSAAYTQWAVGEDLDKRDRLGIRDLVAELETRYGADTNRRGQGGRRVIGGIGLSQRTTDLGMGEQ